MTSFCWPPTTAGSGSSGNTSSGLETTGAPVDVSSAAPPVAGQVLTATDATHAAWRVPGLKYDPAIRFNVDAGGDATIEPGTWGFVYTYPIAAAELTVFVVSSLSAPPVDSRFGLYISPSVAVPVNVSLIGASQIMGLDGTLSTSIVLPPGAMYEWVFYHEGGVAIWGLVSSTLQATNAAPWLTFSSGANPGNGEWIVGGNDTIFLPTASAAAMHCGVLVLLADTATSISCTLSAFQIGRILYNAGSNVPVRSGGWYEWVSVDAGEEFRWLPVASGDDAKSPLEQSTSLVAANPPPNQWILSSDASGVAHTPSAPKSGDSFAIFVNATSATIVPQTGQSILQADGGTLVSAPASITVLGTGYYEWIWIQSSTTWFPRQNVLTPNLNGTQKQPVRFACTVNDTLSGLAARDGVTPVAGDRVLAAFQTTNTANGIYLAASGAWTRAPDANTNAKVKGGLSVYVNEGTTYADTVFVLTANDPITLGTTGLTFSQMGGLKGSGASITTITPIASASTGVSTRWAAIDHGHPYQLPDPTVNGFRLSTSASSPIAVDGTYSTIFLAAYKSNKIALWDTTLLVWQIVTNPTVNSANLTGHTSGTPVDVFARYIGSSTSLAIDLVNWTNASTRASALATRDGVTINSSNSRYLGTFLPDSATTFTISANPAANTKAVCGLWNQDNRVQTSFQWTAPTGTATPVSAGSWAPLPSWSTPHVEMVLGQIYDSHVARAVAGVSITTSAQQAAIGLGIDSTTSVLGIRGMSTGTGAATTSTLTTHRSVRHANPGLHTVNLLGQVSATGPAFSGNQDLVQSGVIVDIWH